MEHALWYNMSHKMLALIEGAQSPRPCSQAMLSQPQQAGMENVWAVRNCAQPLLLPWTVPATHAPSAHLMTFTLCPNCLRLTSQSSKGMGNLPAAASLAHECLKSFRLCGCLPSCLAYSVADTIPLVAQSRRGSWKSMNPMSVKLLQDNRQHHRNTRTAESMPHTSVFVAITQQQLLSWPRAIGDVEA